MDQYNLNEKGMMPMDLHLLLMSLETIKHVCTHEKAKSESFKKASDKEKKEKKHPGTKSMARVPKKVCFEKHCNLCKRHGGTYTMHNTKVVVGMRKMEGRNLISMPLRKALTRGDI